MSAQPADRSRVRRTAWALAAIAMAFYLGFILVGVLKS